MNDKYVHDMDWSESGNGFSAFSNYRRYQYNLIKSYIGVNILEIGTGDRSFTKQILLDCKHNFDLLSIEPSKTLFELSKKLGGIYPNNFNFSSLDLFDMGQAFTNKFDTALLIHVLEHIEHDKNALNHIHGLLKDQGHLLIQVPAYQWLFSDHDYSIGHHRRYDKKSLNECIDSKKYRIVRMWYQDPIGILGSLYFFKLKKTKLKSSSGQKLLSTQGLIYDKFIIPIEEYIEKFINFPIGLNLTAVLQKI